MEEKQLIDGVQKGDKLTFELLYKKYYVFLCTIAEHIAGNSNDAEEIVSDVFLKLWNNRQNLNLTSSLKAYLTKAVQNTSLNYLEKNNAKGITSNVDLVPAELLRWDNNYELGKLYEQEILSLLDQGIKDLPPSCREIFLLSRNEELSYSEIADKLGISVNTVKTQMKIAIAKLREVLKEYLHIIILLLSLKNF